MQLVAAYTLAAMATPVMKYSQNLKFWHSSESILVEEVQFCVVG